MGSCGVRRNPDLITHCSSTSGLVRAAHSRWTILSTQLAPSVFVVRRNEIDGEHRRRRYWRVVQRTRLLTWNSTSTPRKALDLEAPPPLLARAAKVIE